MKERPNVFRVIDRYTAKSLGRLFMMCYKRGVNDAYRYSHDEGMLREHVEQTAGFDKFGLVGAATSRWVYWKNRLSDMAEDDKRYKTLNNYFERMGNFGSNYLSVMMCVAQTFYNRGISDWLDKPNADEINIFNGKFRWWGGKKDVDCYRMRAYVQDICSEQLDSADFMDGDTRVLKYKHWEVFMQAFSFAIVAKKP